MDRSKGTIDREIALLLDMGRRYGQLVKKSGPDRERAEASKRSGRGGRRNGSRLSEGYRGRL